MTVASTLGPVIVLGVEESQRERVMLIVGLLSTILVSFQALIIAAAVGILFHRAKDWGLRVAIAGLSGAIVAAGNALRILAGVRWPGLAPEILEILWFASPLAIWVIGIRPLHHSPLIAWWSRPWRWTYLAFPFIFLLAAMSRVDFRPYTAVSIPTPLAWLLAYGPTLIVVAVGMMGWLAFEEGERRTRRRVLVDTGLIALVVVSTAALALSTTSFGFIITATITWGSGYQLFTAPLGESPLLISLSLVAASSAAFFVTLARLKVDSQRAWPLFLPFVAVLSGVFASSESILGTLSALILLWIVTTAKS